MSLSAEASAFLAFHHRPEIDEHLEEIALLLFKYEIPDEDAITIAHRVADIAAINFKAGMEFQKENE